MRTTSILISALVLALCACASSAGTGQDATVDLTDLEGPWDDVMLELPGRDLTLHVLVAGPVEAERVVLLHGFPDLAYGWREVIGLLSDHYRVIAPDMRGYGGSDQPADGYDLDSLAADVAALIEASAVADGLAPTTPVHLVGHDWGAAVAWHVAIEYPELLASLTAISVPHPAVFGSYLRDDPQQRKKSRYMKLLASRAAPGVMGSMSTHRFGKLLRSNLVANPEALDDDALAIHHAAFDTADEARGPLLYYRTMVLAARDDPGALAEAADVTVPTLVLTGRDDAYLRWEMAEESCGHVSGASCSAEVLDGAGHFLQWEDPTWVAECLERHWHSSPAI